MKRLIAVAGAFVALFLVALNVDAGPAVRVSSAPPPPAAHESLPVAATCAEMEASPVAWVTLAEDGSIDHQVTSYPTGITYLDPVFEYSCIPPKTTLVGNLTQNGKDWGNDKFPLQASNYRGFFDWPIIPFGGRHPVPDGEYEVTFFVGKKMLTSGKVTVGTGQSDPNTIDLLGLVLDKRTQNAIEGATISLLNPGVTEEAWRAGGQKEADVFATAVTDSVGFYSFPKRLDRSQAYPIVVVAKGYQRISDTLTAIGPDLTDPGFFVISMVK